MDIKRAYMWYKRNEKQGNEKRDENFRVSSIYKLGKFKDPITNIS